MDLEKLKQDVGEEKFDEIRKSGLNEYESVRKNGFRMTYEARFDKDHGPVNYDLPDIMFNFTYFVSTVVSYDATIFLNNLHEVSLTDEKVLDLTSAFSLTLDQTLAKIKEITEIASTSITLKNPETKDDWSDLLAAERDYINGVMLIAENMTTLFAVMASIDIDYVDGMDEFMEDVKELYLAMERILEMAGGSANGNEEKSDD